MKLIITLAEIEEMLKKAVCDTFNIDMYGCTGKIHLFGRAAEPYHEIKFEITDEET